MRILKRKARETSREYALRVMTENIVSLELAPGSTVSENELSVELGLSRTPVREALIELAKTNIVEILPQRGSRISLVNYDMVDESCFVRLIFEIAVAKICCQTATPDDFLLLEDNIALQKRYANDDMHYEDFLKTDNDFHMLFFKIAKKQQTYKLMNSMSLHFDRVRSMSIGIHDGNINVRNLENHIEILNAIKANDEQLVEQLLTSHLSRYKNDEEAIRQKYPEYFKQ